MTQAFPRSYREDVTYVCNRLSRKPINRDSLLCTANVLYSKEGSVWNVLSNETINIPYRVYLFDGVEDPEKCFTPLQQIIYHCIFSRSYNGYVRETHIKALLESELPEWAMLYVIKICDEYVLEILQTVYQSLHTRNCEAYRSLCAQNFENIRLGHTRMISYWNEFYRRICYRYKDYIGKRLYSECFGYRKTGQKSIQIK